MLGIKTKVNKRLDNYLNLVQNPKNTPFFIENIFLAHKLRQKLIKETSSQNIQLPLARKVNKYATFITKKLAGFMPNNLGNWSINQPHSLSTNLEKKVIEIMKNYYHCSKKTNGHFTSGSTEGNIYAAWIGRNYLMKKLKLNSTNKIVFLHSSLGHYSLSKAADLINVKGEELAINNKKWNIDPDYLEKTLKKLQKKGFCAFLIPLTIGYTVTGTDDNIEKICQIIEKFKKNNNKVEFFIWIDAAFSGISKIFAKEVFRPFANKNIKLITTDFHKLLAVPYSSGFVLYKNGLANFIKRNIPYIGIEDTTLLGSRSGINVIATWFTLINLNQKKLKNIFTKVILEKEKFLEKIAEEKLNLEIINNKNSTQACLICNNKDDVQKIEKKYSLEHLKYNLLFPKGHKEIIAIKLYFSPKFN